MKLKMLANQGFPVAGAFKSNKAFQTTQYKWHYSGAFWWARSQNCLKIDYGKRCVIDGGVLNLTLVDILRQEGYRLFRPLYAGEFI